jgi:hypothetical protein
MGTAALFVLSVIGAVTAPSKPRSTPLATELREYMRAYATGAVVGALGTAASRSARLEKAMPMFARKYGVPCTTCHTTIPRLNLTGYKFRAAGFRMPEEIGQYITKKFELGNYFSGRIQSRFDVQATNQPNGAAVANLVNGAPGPRTTTIAPSFAEATIYPVTGSFGKYFGALSELSVSPEDVFEIENAYVRFVAGNAKTFFTARAGIFHPWEGFGASDRPFSNGRPLFQTSPISAGGRAIPYVYQPWGLDEVGLEVGVDRNRLSLRAAILGGTLMRWEEEANAFLPFPAQTGPWKGANQAVAALGKPFNAVGHNTPDFSAHATYILHPDGGAVSLQYYRGNVATPTACTDGTLIGQSSNGVVCGVTASTAAAPFGEAGNTDFDFSASTAFKNTFDRLAVYASYPVGKFFLPQAGFQYGTDENPDATKFHSKGAFLDGAFSISEKFTVGARYDWFHPRSTTQNVQWAFTPYVNVPLQNGLQIIGEFQHRDFELAPGTYHRKNDTFQVRLILIQ